jgi:hypothetical protein
MMGLTDTKGYLGIALKRFFFQDGRLQQAE